MATIAISGLPFSTVCVFVEVSIRAILLSDYQFHPPVPDQLVRYNTEGIAVSLGLMDWAPEIHISQFSRNVEHLYSD